ncbi:MAG: cupin domain-containing protein [Actinomycetota bacterium]|nr:cupin domain-containing protein [Actinomycetota bacterium]
MRSPVELLGLERTGVTLQHILPGQRQSFGHAHSNAEETYIVLEGSGTLRIGDDELALAARDAVRVSPALTRAFEAGPDGLEYLAVGPRHRGDGEIAPGWWG